MQNRTTIWSTLALACALATQAAAITPADKCEADKLKRAGKYNFCRLKAEAKAVKTGDPADFSKCDMKLSEKWTNAETKGGGFCPTNGDLAAMQTRITADADDIVACLNGACPISQLFPATGEITAYGTGSDGDVQAGSPLSYTDNGDGTITDNNTGLMWEKKDDSGGIHDQDNLYTWCADVSPADSNCDNGTNAMDGTIVTTFLAGLNGGAGFAGYTDWRIPNVKELHSIIDFEVENPSVGAVFHQSATCTGCTDVTAATCSCTQFTSSDYWSSTTSASGSQYAWRVGFGAGLAEYNFKAFTFYVRAVRGGL